MDYIMAGSITEVLSILHSSAGSARIIAGGTDLLIDLETNRLKADTLVDISGISELLEIKAIDNELIIGGAVTHTMAARSELVRKFAPALASACGKVGSLQIRNIATVAGNVVNAQPAADAAVALAALGAFFIVTDSNGSRRIAMSEMYKGIGKSAIDSSREVLASIRIPCQGAWEASEFIRLELRKSLALPMLNVAAAVKATNGVVDWARIAMAPVGVGPVRAVTAEKWLVGRSLNESIIKEASQKVLAEANPRSNPLRGTKEYRMATLPVLVSRALTSIEKQLVLRCAFSKG